MPETVNRETTGSGDGAAGELPPQETAAIAIAVNVQAAADLVVRGYTRLPTAE